MQLLTRHAAATPAIPAPARRLIAAHGLSAVAMGLPWPALLVAVWDETHSDSLLGAAGAARLAPYIVLSWLAGRIADRYACGRMVTASLVSRLGALLLTTVFLGSGLILPAVVCASLAVAFGTPAYPSIAAELPHLAGRASDNATGLLVTFEVAAFFVGPAVGGLALGWDLSVLGCWLACGLTAAALALTRGVAWAPHRNNSGAAAAGEGRPGLLAVLAAHRPAAVAVVALAVNNVVAGAVAIVLLPLAISAWDGGSSEFGVATTAVGVGALAAPLALRAWGLSSAAGRRSAVLLGGFLVLTAVTPTLWWAFLPLAASGAATVHLEAVATRLIQCAAPEGTRSSVLGLADSVMVAAAAGGAAIAPWAAESLGARQVIALCAAGALAMLVMFPAPALLAERVHLVTVD